jgi:hypothetical protein
MNDAQRIEIMKQHLAEAELIPKVHPVTAARAAAEQAGEWASWTLDHQLWYLRVSRGFKQLTLAAQSGVSQARISRLEDGEDFKFSTLKAIWAPMGLAPLILPEPLGVKKVPRPYKQRWNAENGLSFGETREAGPSEMSPE